MKEILAALLLSHASPAGEIMSTADNLIPTVNISAIRHVMCDDWSGSGYLIDKDVLVTDLHVASGTNCKDDVSGATLYTYKKDEVHDLAVMTGKLPEMPYYIRISCERYKKGEEYTAYGISSYYINKPIIRQVNLTGTGIHATFDYDDGDGGVKDIAYLLGNIVPGMSGGPITNRAGYALGNNVAGESDFLGYPVGKSYSYEFADTFLCKR